ncbi:hypothetical protein [Geminicoccus harenae]|uniref:hypothetical protein n=2 Tax=Geminicoccus harenae TaxID=2498453 RepID=UPI001C96FC25|nr:hypothetical protein [Geminicoccus harenae]
MQRAYSVSQIQFDCLSYIKEFGARPEEWLVGTAEAPEPFLEVHGGAGGLAVPWLAKPALTPKAAQAVAAGLHRRYGVALAAPPPDGPRGRYVCLLRRPAG